MISSELFCGIFGRGNHCMKSVHIRSFFWFIFSRIRTEYGEILRISSHSEFIFNFRSHSIRFDESNMFFIDAIHPLIIINTKATWRWLEKTNQMMVQYKNWMTQPKLILTRRYLYLEMKQMK